MESGFSNEGAMLFWDKIQIASCDANFDDEDAQKDQDNLDS